MALGTPTLGSRGHQATILQTYVDTVTFAGDGAYPTGGTASFTAFLRGAIGHNVTPMCVVPNDCGGYVPVYDHVADKLKVYFGDNDNAADGPLVEVPNATDLSGVTFRLVVISK